jgi:hypothetical protein
MVIARLRSGERVQLHTRGRSMWPAIPSHSLVEVEPCAAAELDPGAVAAFERGGKVIVHRVQRVSATGVHFAGDSLKFGDGCIPFAQVLGRVQVLERRPLRWRLPQRSDARRLWWLIKRRLLEL